MGGKLRSRDAFTESLDDAEVERFFKKGILDNRVEFCGGAPVGVGWSAVKVCCGSGADSPRPTSEGPFPAAMSPKYCSDNRTASLWFTPAKATTIRSGL